MTNPEQVIQDVRREMAEHRRQLERDKNRIGVIRAILRNGEASDERLDALNAETAVAAERMEASIEEMSELERQCQAVIDEG